MKLIGFSGHKKAGKDTSVTIVYNQLRKDYYIFKVGFALDLKLDVCRMYNISLEYLEHHKDNFRLILQGTGTDYRRKLFGDDYWIKKWRNRVQYILEHEPNSFIIVNDVRFQNEFDCIKKLKGLTIRVVAKNNPFQEIDTHASECELDSCDKFDYTIVNDFEDINVLKKEIETLIKKEYPSHV